MSDWNDEHENEQMPEGSTGKMLFYFFGVVILCAVALAIGYTMGKRSTPPVAADTGAPTVTAAASPSGAAKPGASRALNSDTPKGSADAIPADDSAKGGKTSPGSKSAEKPMASAVPSKPAPEIASVAGKGFMVQVAAVSRPEDAEALANALRKKQYPVLVMPGTGSDKLVHVQVGPFAKLEDAEAMKAKLAADGYNAIVKK